jgi:dTDP-L-rhamnose 4-epimerase
VSKALITGGAGFVGSHLADALLAEGMDVVVYDCLDGQVHPKSAVPDYLDRRVTMIKADVRDRIALRDALDGADAVFHFAAAVGVGQSMYEIVHYADTNVMGTAALLQLLAEGNHRVRKLVIASSMSIYGEGEYACEKCGRAFPTLREKEQLERRDWDLNCPTCSRKLHPVQTKEDKPLYPTSVYAISKRDQEEMCLSVGRAYGIPTIALRFFNIYGSRQALSNPYTGVAAIFSSRILNGNPPLIFEDGHQIRDFVHVSDIVQANVLAMKSGIDYGVFNVGSGRHLSILDVANILCDRLGSQCDPIAVNKFREGDTRHCFGDITAIREKLGYQPKVRFEDGVEELTEWVKGQEASDQVEKAARILEQRGRAK